MRLAWKALKDKYQIENAASKIELKKQFTQKVMKNGQDPNEWLMELDHLRNRLQAMKSSIQDEDYIIHILSNLTQEYSELVTVLEGELETITVDKLKERIRGFSRRKRSEGCTTDGSTHALLNVFKGRCNCCGKYEHKGINCPQRKEKWKDLKKQRIVYVIFVKAWTHKEKLFQAEE